MPRFSASRTTVGVAVLGSLLYVKVKAFTLAEIVILVAFISLIAQIPPPGLFLADFDIGENNMTITLGSNETCQYCTYDCNTTRILANVTAQLDDAGVRPASDSEIYGIVQRTYFRGPEESAPADFPPVIADGLCSLDPSTCVPIEGCVPPFDPCDPSPFECATRAPLPCCPHTLGICVRTCLQDCPSRKIVCLRKCISRFLECVEE